jgi:hypothetical protein
VIATESEFDTDHEVADIDGDGRNDVVGITTSALLWFRNPDCNFAFLYLLATKWRESAPDAGFVFARNDGGGRFGVRPDLPAGSGDFLQGAALARFTSSQLQVALSWHAPRKGIELLTIPGQPTKDAWRLEKLFDEIAGRGVERRRHRPRRARGPAARHDLAS